MTRPVTLFTGQWADLPFEEVARLAGEWGYDGLEIACWGDHFDPWAAVEDPAYIRGRREILEKHGLQVFAISNHLTGQAVCDDPIDERHRGILPARVWGDGEPEGVRQRAAEAMQVTARAAAALGVQTVVGFTGSKIWKTVAMFPPVPESMVDDGYRDFADRWNPTTMNADPLAPPQPWIENRFEEERDHHHAGSGHQLGPRVEHVADDVRAGVLRDRDDGRRARRASTSTASAPARSAPRRGRRT